jgi:hypothetical protein
LTLKKTNQLFSITNDQQIQLQPRKTQPKRESVFSKLFDRVSPSKIQPTTAAKIQFTQTSVSRNKLRCRVALLDDYV